MLSGAGILALIIALAVTPAGQTFLQIVAVYFSGIVDAVRGWLGLAPGAPLT